MRPLRPPRSPLPVLALALVSLFSSAANAGPDTEAELNQARERFVAARKFEDAGRWGEALALLQRVAEVKMTPQVRFHIALCMENIGLWTEALDGYADAAGEAKSSAPDVVREANDHIRKLEGSMPTVTLRVRDAAIGDELYLDRRALPIDDRALAIRADPGPHSAEVRRGESVVAREYFTLEPKTTRRIDLRVGSVAQTPSGWTGPPGSGVGAAAGQGGPHDRGSAQPSPPGNGNTQRALGYATLGLAGLSIVATGTFIGLRAGALNRLEAACPALTRCPRSVEQIVREGKTYAALVNVFGILGGVAAASGVVLLVTAPPRQSAPGKRAPAASFAVSPVVGRSMAGVSVEGAF